MIRYQRMRGRKARCFGTPPPALPQNGETAPQGKPPRSGREFVNACGTGKANGGGHYQQLRLGASWTGSAVAPLDAAFAGGAQAFVVPWSFQHRRAAGAAGPRRRRNCRSTGPALHHGAFRRPPHGDWTASSPGSATAARTARAFNVIHPAQTMLGDTVSALTPRPAHLVGRGGAPDRRNACGDIYRPQFGSAASDRRPRPNDSRSGRHGLPYRVHADGK